MWWLLLFACGPDGPAAPPATPACGIAGTPDWREPASLPRDGELTLAHLQARGTHNSTHQEPDVVLDASHAYTQPPLPEQLGSLGVRQLELDIHLRDDGGFDVFHLPGIDPISSCPTLAECLEQVCVWSASNREHAPVLIWFEPKDELDGLTPGFQPFTGQTGALEDEILSIFPRDRVYAPDDWRRGQADLGTATAALGPPTLDQVRGKVLFGLLDSGDHRADYLAESPDLAGRLLFPDTDAPTDSFAALVKDADPAELPALHAAGLVVTGNVDGASDSEADNTASRDAALAAGLHYAATDFPAEGPGYWMALPAGDPVACNPATAPADCVAADLE